MSVTPTELLLQQYAKRIADLEKAVERLKTLQAHPIGVGGGWTDDGAVVRLTTAADNVGVGTAVVGAGNKMQVAGHIGQVYGYDVKPQGAFLGLGNRLITPLGTPTDHFQTGVITPGYAWAPAAGVMNGVPGTLNYSVAGDYLACTAGGAGQRHMLYAPITNAGASWQNQAIIARMRAGQVTEIGLRVDNGNSAANQPFVEWFLSGAAANGSQTLYIRYQNVLGGGITTTASGVVTPTVQYVILYLICFYSAPNYQFMGWTASEDGAGTVDTTGLTTGVIAWVPCAGRVGVFFKDRSNWALCDWFRNTFT